MVSGAFMARWRHGDLVASQARGRVMGQQWCPGQLVASLASDCAHEDKTFASAFFRTAEISRAVESLDATSNGDSLTGCGMQAAQELSRGREEQRCKNLGCHMGQRWHGLAGFVHLNVATR